MVSAIQLSAAPFTLGNLVVYRVGTGAGALSSAATAVFLDEYTTAGVFVQSIPLPTADAGGNQILTGSGTATSDGLMTRSADGAYLVLMGYDAPVGTLAVAGTSTTGGAAVLRVVGRVSATGVVDTTTTTTNFSAGNARSVASIDGSAFWATGSNTGVVYLTFSPTSATVVSTTVTNLRGASIFGGQLYVSSGAAVRLATVGTGTPTTPGQTATNLPGFPTTLTSPNQFFLADINAAVAGIDTAYVSDDRAVASGGGVQKWTFDGTTWTQRGTLSAGLSNGLRGLTGSVSGTNVTLYGTDSATLPRLVTATDTSGANATITGTFSIIVTSPTNMAFRSVALAPATAAPPTVLSINRAGASSTSASSVDFTVTFSENVTGVDGSDFTVTGTLTATGSVDSVTPVSGSVYTVTVGSVVGDGTIRLDLNSSGTGIASTPAGIPIATGFNTGQTYTIDNTGPAVTSVGVPPNGTYGTGQQLNFVANFDENVIVDFSTGIPYIPITLNTGGTVQASYAGGTGTSAIAFSYTVASGNLDLDGIAVGGSIVANGGTLRDEVTNDANLTLNGVPSTAGVLVDATDPVVLSITRADANPTNATTIHFTVTFSTSVTGVDLTDFALTTTGAFSTPGITGLTGSGDTYTVTVQYSAGVGTIRLDLNDNDSIVNGSSVPLGGPGAGNGSFTTGQIYTVDTIPPAVQSMTRDGASPTNASTVSWTVVFDDNVTGVDATDFAALSSSSTATISGVSPTNATTYVVSVNTGTANTDSIGLQLVDDDSIVDIGTNPLGGAGAGNGNFTAGTTYTIDRVVPVVSSIIRAGANPTAGPAVDFNVTFSKNVTGVDVSDFTLTTTGLSGASVTNVATSNFVDYTVTANVGGGSGTIRLDLTDNDSISDSVGNLLGGAGTGNGNFTTGEIYTVQAPPAAPTGLIATPGNNTVGLTWTASASATSYNVKRSTTSGSGHVTIANVASPSYTDNAVTNGTTYYYVVSALNASGESPDSSQVSATPNVPANQIGVVISQLYGGNGNAYSNDYIELFNPTTQDRNIGGYALHYGSATGQFGSVGTNIFTFPPGTTLAAGKYLTVKFGTAGSGLPVTADLDGGASSLNMSGTSGKVAFAISGATLLCGATATPCTLPDSRIVDVVAYGTSNNGEGGTTVNNGAAISASSGPLRKLSGCQDTNNNNNDFIVATTATGLAPRTLGTTAYVCGPLNFAPNITAPPNPAATVAENAAPFTVTLTGTDDGGIYNWSATAGAGVSSVIITAGQGTSSVTYQVTLQTNFFGTATFTAALTDNVNTPATQTVNIQVDRDVTINHAPTITPPANPVTSVAQNSAPVNVNITGNDDNNLYTWSATPGTGVTAVIITAGQGTPTVTYNVTIQTGFIGTATFTASLSDGVNPATTQTVNIGVSPTGSSVTHVVISQIYPGGGNVSASYANDYVELYNPTGSPVSLNGWSLQYSPAANTGNSTGIMPLGGIIGPGEYFLLALAAGTNPAPALPAPNLNGDINMAAAGGKIALVRNFDALTGTCGTLLTDADIVDFVGYGTANCSEGGSTAPTAPNNATALFRANNGDTDTDNNGADFAAGTPNPRRTSPIQEIGPFVIFTDPSSGENIAPRDANLVITFTEPVDITGTWYDIACAVTGNHNSATFSQSGTRSFTIVPNVNFQAGEQCTATLFASAIRDTDTDDSNPGTDFLPSNYVWTFTIASGTPPPFPPSVHLTMGNPSGAVDDTNVPNNYLMEKPEMALSYNRDKGIPNWVGWHLSSEWIGSLVRIDTFRADPAVLPTWYRVLGSSYSNSGFDRGHMMPNADRDKETSVPINQATFLMTNMLPQAADNNQGPWADMENDLRTIVGGSNELYIYSGGAGSGGTGGNGFATTIDNGHVAVPSSTWKVVMVLSNLPGDDVARVTASTRTIAVILPNVQGIRTNDWLMYLTTVDAVESLTGYDFFSNVPDAIENAIEAGTDGTPNPPGAANESVSVNEDSSSSFTLDAVSPSGGPLTYTILTPPSHGDLTGSGANRTYTPVPDYNGSDSFTFRVNDGSRDSNIATATITVLEVNDPPVANNDTKNANGTLSFPAADLTANDITGPSNESAQTLTVTIVTATANTHGTVSLSDGTVTYTPAPGYSGPADFSYTACDNGVTAGLSASLCASATVNLSVTVPIQTATHFSVTAPAGVTNGVPFNVTVTALDALNATVTGYTGTIHFTSSSAGTLPADYTFVGGDNGTHTFSVTLTANGSQTITAADGGITGTATTNVAAPEPSPATHFSVTAPANVIAGSPFNVTVTALDEANAVVTSFTGTVHFTANGPGTLPADYTFVAGDNGTHTFSATLTTGGTQTITVTSGSITGNVTTTVSMVVPPPIYLLITGPANATIGVPFNVTVSAHVSLNGPIVTSYAGIVSFSSSSAATLPPAYTYVEGDAGSHTFSLTPNAIGPMMLSVADTNGNYSLPVTITIACATTAGTVPVSVSATSCTNSAGNAASVFVPGASTWTWQITNGTITSGQGTASIVFTAGASGSVALSVTTSNGDGCALQSGSASVAISPAPTATLPSSVQGCALAPVSILVRLTGTPPFNIRWSDGLQQSNINAMQITREFASSTSTTLRIVSVADASCATNTSSAPVRVVVVPAPVFLIEPEDVKIKGGETATLFVLAAGATQYQWFEGALGDETHPVGTSATFVTPALRATTKYWARATGPCGRVDSREVTVKVTGKRRGAGH